MPQHVSDVTVMSPRAFCDFDHRHEPQPKHFVESVLNSFPDLLTRTRFLNKFYQCLLANGMPHKVRKLVVCGERDSGKTMWGCIFDGIVPKRFIASVSKEGVFGFSMLTPDTQLVRIDEWSEAKQDADTIKNILQGDYHLTFLYHLSLYSEHSITLYIPITRVHMK